MGDTNKNLCFVAKIIYPAKDQNLASINFEQNEAANNNVNLDIELGIKQIPSTEEGRAEFCFTVTPGIEKETEALPDIEVEFRYKQHLIENEFNPIKTSEPLKGGGETNMSVSIPSSVFPYECQARAKYIGGAVGPWIEKEKNAVQAFHVLEFVDLRYERTWSELIVNIKNMNVAEHNQNKTEDEQKEDKEKLSPLFDVQFEYRFLGSENETIFKTTAVLMDDDYISALPDVEGNTIEFRCRYVVCHNDNMQAFTMMDGSLVGEWTDFESCEIDDEEDDFDEEEAEEEDDDDEIDEEEGHMDDVLDEDIEEVEEEYQDDDEWRFIESNHSGMVLDIAEGKCGGRIITYPKHGGDNQLWKLEGNALISKTGYALDIEGGNRSAGANVICWNHHGGENQQWTVQGDNIISLLNGLSLDIKGGSKDSNVEIVLWPSHNGDNQSWRFVKQ